MRLGGQIFGRCTTPQSWVEAVKAAGYRAAYCPVGPDAEAGEIQAYLEAAQCADITIAEVGAWSNPLSPDEQERAAAIERCKKGLLLADKVRARCCVNIAGSRGGKWDGPCPDDLTDETFQMIVDTVRDIIDSVKPTWSCYTLETMPWMYPDSPDSYLALIRAIDREAFAAHLDPVNLICSPQRYFRNTEIIKECFAKLAPHIRSCHAKDIVLRDKLTVHLDEVRPGLGGLDYRCFLRELAKLDADTPLMLEHLRTQEDCAAAAEHIRAVARTEGVGI